MRRSTYSNESTGDFPPASLPSGSMPSHSNVKLGPTIGLNAAGPRLIKDVGGSVFAEKNRYAGEASHRPSLSRDATLNTCRRTSFTGSTRKRSVVSLAVVVGQSETGFKVSSSTAKENVITSPSLSYPFQ